MLSLFYLKFSYVFVKRDLFYFISESFMLKQYEVANIFMGAQLAAEITDNFLAVIHNLYWCL